jgi:hypothetical protein
MESRYVLATPKSHRKRWVELIPLHRDATLNQVEDEMERRIDPFDCRDPFVRPEYRDYRFSSRDFEILLHDQPTENLQKIMDLGYKEGQACRILDTLGIE